ncbi:MAG: hypothetical protein QN122_12055 [Armatimonadota bacterium]|nr:hypothetical protein [Armatimonadota bacterium]
MTKYLLLDDADFDYLELEALDDDAAIARGREWATEWVDTSMRAAAGRESGQPITCRAWLYRLDSIDDFLAADYRAREASLVAEIEEVVQPLYVACDGGLTDDPEEHAWVAPYQFVGGVPENPGVWGHGGGVVVREVCRRCGALRIVDTWADDGRGGHCRAERLLALREWASPEEEEAVRAWLEAQTEEAAAQ